MKYLKLFVFIFLLIGEIYAQEDIDTSYILMQPISKSCKNIVFTDSMYRAWNCASIENIKRILLKEKSVELRTLLLQFTKGENSRLQFCKTLNDDSLITKEDFKNGFFIIEEEICGSSIHCLNYLIIDRDSFFEIKSYKLFFREFTWNLQKEKIISKHKFYRLFNKIKKQNRNDEIYTIREFIVTKFTEEKIESYVFACKGCKKCIYQFYDLIGK